MFFVICKADFEMDSMPNAQPNFEPFVVLCRLPLVIPMGSELHLSSLPGNHALTSGIMTAGGQKDLIL